MWRQVRRWLVRMVEARGAAAFLTASLAVGLLVGIGASVLVWAISFVAWLAGHASDTLGTASVLVAIPLGFMVAWLLDRRLGPGILGGGVSETMVGLSLRGGYLPTRTILPKIAATAATLGVGGSAGQEGPIVQIGATIGSSFGRYTRFGEDQIRGLVAAGAAAGIAAAFNAPIAGMLFAMEVIIGGFGIRHLNAVVVASVTAAVTATELVGEGQLLTAPSHRIGHPGELVLYAILALLCVAFGIAFTRVSQTTADVAGRWPPVMRPIGLGLALSILVLIDPDLLGTGQELLKGMLSLGPDSGELWVGFAVLAILKIFAAAFTGKGGSGGAMMPSLVIGGSLGAAFGLLIAPAWNLSTLDPGAFAVVGMAATFAATGRAPLTSILIVFEVTGDYNLVLPLMLSAALATFIGDRIHPDSIYTLPLTRRGIHLTRTEDIDLLDTVTVAQVMTMTDAVVRPDMSVDEVEEALHRDHHHGLAVVDGRRLVGIVTVTDLEAADPAAPVSAVMTPRPITAFPEMPVSAALARMASLGVGRLPVVSDETPDHYVGMFRRNSIVEAYHLALGATADRQMYRERLRQRIQPGASFFEIPIPPGSAAHGRRVSDLAWPETATLVSVRRGGSVHIPHGATVLHAGDTITAFGSGDARVELAFLVEPAPEAEPPDLG